MNDRTPPELHDIPSGRVLPGCAMRPTQALSPQIGYDKASAIAHEANDAGLTLKEAALKSGYIDEKRFDEIVDPKKMVGDGVVGG
jgi:fumarate hydratase, class II